METDALVTSGKINLYLRVTGRREDGYHTLETLFLPLESPGDRVEMTFDAAPGIAIEADEGVPSGMDNIACRAASLYASAAEIEPSWSIRITKGIPVAAGMGGGSADAAGVLSLLEKRYGKVGDERLRALALQLGADVPFFLNPVPSVAVGVGEELTPVDFSLPPLYLVLVNPGFPVSAKWAYQHLMDNSGAKGNLQSMLDALESGELGKVSGEIRNDLAAALWKKFPLLSAIRKSLESNGALKVEVSGSGPTLFALMPGAKEADEAALALKQEYKMFKVFSTKVK